MQAAKVKKVAYRLHFVSASYAQHYDPSYDRDQLIDKGYCKRRPYC